MSAAIYPTAPIFAGDTWPGIPAISIRPNEEIPTSPAESAKILFYKAEDGPLNPALTLASPEGVTLVSAENWDFDVPPVILDLPPGEWTFRFSTTVAGVKAVGAFEMIAGFHTLVSAGDIFAFGAAEIIAGTDIAATFASNAAVIDALVAHINTTAPESFPVIAQKITPDILAFQAKTAGNEGNAITLSVTTGEDGPQYIVPAAGGLSADIRTWLTGIQLIL